jgi:hypothetical protein
MPRGSVTRRGSYASLADKNAWSHLQDALQHAVAAILKENRRGPDEGTQPDRGPSRTLVSQEIPYE